ncbi:hypothetical protein EZJ43_13360 [Pedobacter changchengzhani]|uniref:Uncharacterized protein n=1 Tax=Pedobacter changchengzhani TaxID=2529274 RepID=A0A4R5MJ98_9SPHI|nr:hypothetical protein [Pedobacter changchengzhani]TDG35602.1 hypothetical protein EZJ43_13360 [Pedobacter changchengzhani]
MKNMLLIILVAFIAIFLLESCTTINLSPKLLVNKSKYNKFPELSDGLEWGTFKMNRITETSGVNLRYFPQKNFFLVSNYISLQEFNPIKIDSLGNTVFQLNLYKRNDADFIDAINCFVILSNEVYDFSADKPTAVPFSEVLNKENTFTSEKWIETFEAHYQQADIVLYGWITELQSAQCVYFQTAGKWVKLYEFDSSGPSFIYPDGSKIKCKINRKEIPEKLYEEHFLKDATNLTYSNEHRYTDEYITPYTSAEASFFPDQALTYKKAGEIKTLAFSKEMSTSDGYMNPGIPTRFYGTAFYELNIDGDILNFKNNAIKSNGFSEKTETDLFLFSLPEKFLKKSALRFLTYDYGINVHENGKKGVYVIRKKGN